MNRNMRYNLAQSHDDAFSRAVRAESLLHSLFTPRPLCQARPPLLHAMKTRSRGESEKKTAEEEDIASLLPQSPRSSKKRKAPTSAAPATSTTPSAAQRAVPSSSAKKAKVTAGAGAVAVPPTTPASSETRAGKATNAAGPAAKGASDKGGPSVNGQGKAKGKATVNVAPRSGDGNVPVNDVAATAPAVGVAPVIPRGRCVSGRDWKARNQSQR